MSDPRDPQLPPSHVCPNCRFINTYVAAYCAQCTEPLARSASNASDLSYDPWILSPELKKTGKPSPAAAAPDPSASTPSIPTRLHGNRRFLIGCSLLLIGGLGGVGLMHWKQAATSATVEGSPLGHRFFAYGTYKYLIGYKNTWEIWSSRNSRLDRRLSSTGSDDTGTLKLSTLSATPGRQMLVIEPVEWIAGKTLGNAHSMQPLEPEHASLEPARVLLDREGDILNRTGLGTTRLGKALPFLMPVWPKGLRRPADRWTETIEWVDGLDAWTVQWKAELRWTLAGYETCGHSSCARLTYDARLTPLLKEVPVWAAKVLSAAPQFSGSGRGVALFDMQQNQLVSNSFSYHGTLTVPLSDIGRIPTREDAPAPVHEPGAVVIQLSENVNVSKP